MPVHHSAWRVPTEIPVRFRTLDAPIQAAVMGPERDGCQLRADALTRPHPDRTALRPDRQHGELVAEGRICYVQEETSLRPQASAAASASRACRAKRAACSPSSSTT